MNDHDYELLSAYIDGTLSDAERAALEARLTQEADLQQALNSLQHTVMLLRQMPELSAPRDFTLDADKLAARPARTALPFPLTATFSALSAAAAVLLFVFGAYFLLRSEMMFPAGGVMINQEAPAQMRQIPTAPATIIAAQPTMLPPATAPPMPNAAAIEDAAQPPPAPPITLSEPEPAMAEEEAVMEGFHLFDDSQMADGEQAAGAEVAEMAQQADSADASAAGLAQEDDTDAAPEDGAGTADEVIPQTEPPAAAARMIPAEGTPAPQATLLPEVVLPPAEETRTDIPADPARDYTGWGLLAAGAGMLAVAVLTTIGRRRRHL